MAAIIKIKLLKSQFSANIQAVATKIKNYLPTNTDI